MHKLAHDENNIKKEEEMGITCAEAGNIECSTPNVAVQPISNLSDVLKKK